MLFYLREGLHPSIGNEARSLTRGHVSINAVALWPASNMDLVLALRNLLRQYIWHMHSYHKCIHIQRRTYVN